MKQLALDSKINNLLKENIKPIPRFMKHTYNLITPNKDAKNDTFFIDGIENDKDGVLNIYNRWGSVIFTSTNYQNNWGGDDVSDGVYYYSYEHKSCGTIKGWVQIIK